MLRTLFSRDSPQEERAMQVRPWGNWNSATGSAAGMGVSEDTAYNLLAVYGSVQLISETIATLPRDIFRTVGQTNEEVPNKPRWFEQPNPRTDIIEFLSQSLNSLLLDGNAYWAYSTDLNFAPTEIHVLNPTQVQVHADPNDPRNVTYLVKGVPFTGRMVHIKGLTRPGAVKGMSPIEAAMQSIGIGLAVQEYAGNFYKNGTTLSGAITTPGPLTEDQAVRMKEKFSQAHGGSQNAHLPAVLTNGATWQQISVTPEQAQFLESRNFQASEIVAQMFLLDPSMLGISVGRGQNMTYANLEQRGIHLAQFTLMRWIIRLERAFTFLLPKPQFMKFNVDAIQRADLLTRYEAHRIALGPTQPFETVNEVRALEDEPPMAGFDTIEKPAAPVLPKPPEPVVVQNHYTSPISFAAAQPADIHNYIAAPLPLDMPDISVNLPAVEPPIVHNHVETPAVTVEAARAPDVHVDVAAALPADVTVNVPEMTPIVHTHVDAPVVNVAAAKSPIVHNIVEGPKTVRKSVIRDEEDRIVAVEETSD